MHIHKAELVTSGVKEEHYPKIDLPEIILAGRSNVGKSTFINTMLNRKNLAYTSSKPGKTQLLNFFNINDKFIFVDVPGYGYAKVSKEQQKAFGKMFDNYVQTRENLELAILLIDLRHKPTEDDISMLEYFRYFNLNILVVGTKLDKLKSSEKQAVIKKRKLELGLKSREIFIPYTALKKENNDDIWNEIFKCLSVEKD